MTHTKTRDDEPTYDDIRTYLDGYYADDLADWDINYHVVIPRAGDPGFGVNCIVYMSRAEHDPKIHHWTLWYAGGQLIGEL